MFASLAAGRGFDTLLWNDGCSYEFINQKGDKLTIIMTEEDITTNTDNIVVILCSRNSRIKTGRNVFHKRELLREPPLITISSNQDNKDKLPRILTNDISVRWYNIPANVVVDTPIGRRVVYECTEC